MKVLYNYALNPWTATTMAFLLLKFWGLFFFLIDHTNIIIQIRQVLTRIYFAQMLFMSCNWRLNISQTAREAILNNSLGCSPRPRSELSGRVSGKRNCQWFKNILQHDIQILQMLYLWYCTEVVLKFTAQVYIFSSEKIQKRLPTLNESWPPRHFRTLHSLWALPGLPTPTAVK